MRKAGHCGELCKVIKSFYMRVNDDGRTVAAMDVTGAGIGEIIGGSQREERFEVLDRCIAGRGIDKEHHAPTLPSPQRRKLGQGGIQRTLGYLTGLSNVRDEIPSPRTPGRYSTDASASALIFVVTAGGCSASLGTSAPSHRRQRRLPSRLVGELRVAFLALGGITAVWRRAASSNSPSMPSAIRCGSSTTTHSRMTRPPIATNGTA